MRDQWLNDMDKGKINVVFLDVRKAFDSIKHEIILVKLKIQFGICDIEPKLFESYLTNEYCFLCGIHVGKHFKKKLQKIQFRAVKSITGAPYEVRSTDVLNILGGQTLDAKRLKNKLKEMYKILKNHTAPNLNEFFCRRNAISTNYDLRGSGTDLNFTVNFLRKFSI